MKKIAILLVLVLSISSCKKDDSVIPFAQQAASQIQSAVSKVGASRTKVYMNNVQIDYSETPVSFDGDFIIVERTRYNLNKLVGFTVFNNNGQTLFLYF